MSAVGLRRLTIATVVKDDVEGLRRTLDSLVSALTHDEQLLIVDSSGDPSATRALIAMTGVAHDYAWVEPQGVYAAMNAALDLAEGEYIWFINAGDVLHSTKALVVVRDLLGSHPSWVYGQVSFVGASGRVVVPKPFDYDEEAGVCFSRGRFPPHQGTIVETETLRSLGGFDTSYRVVADYAVVLRLSLLAKPRVTSETLADFHQGGLSTRQWRAALGEFHRARKEIVHPEGRDMLVERWYTVREFSLQCLYRSWVSLKERARRGMGGDPRTAE